MGIMLLIGLGTRLLGLLVCGMLLSIVINLLIFLPLNDIVMRDLALSTASLLLFFFGSGKYSLDRMLGIE